VIDVRKNVEYDMCHLPFSVNIQLNDLKREKTLLELIKQINSYSKTPNGK
jgi:rhodanese-related sulfurtransferase